MATKDSLPLVDFEGVLLSNNLAACPQVQEIHDAFTEVGFVFITNHGIDQELINKAFSVSLDFFCKPEEVKQKYLYRHMRTDHNGYLPYHSERTLNALDEKEAYEICNARNDVFPDDEIPDFRSVTVSLFREAIRVGWKVLEVMGLALRKDPSFFVKKCAQVGEGCQKNYTDLRTLYYPAFPQDFDFAKLSTTPDNYIVRLNEHVDFGMLTILFPSPQEVGGLQVKKSDGKYIDVPYIRNAILVNLGEIMQMWTADKYKATPHRVIIPDAARHMARQSIVMFIHPDSDTIIECIDDSNKYKTFMAGEWTEKKTNETVVH